MTITTGYSINSTLVKPEKPLVHSWSSLNDYKNCPWRFYLTRVAKTVKEKQSAQMTEGNDRHKALEVAVRDGMALPKKYEGDLPMVQMLRNAEGNKIVEWQFGLTRNWDITGFFGDDVWIRGKIDFGVIRAKTAIIIDYKDGKRKTDSEQLALFAVPTFAGYPFLERVYSAYAWLKDGKLDREEFVPEDMPELKERFAIWISRVEDSAKRGVWPKQPSGLCKEYCPVGRGNCEYCGS
jgi:hypothetical protein